MAKITGVSQTIGNLQRIGNAPTVTIDQACRRALVPLTEETKALAPFNFLRRSVAVVKKATGNGFRTYWMAFRGQGRSMAHLIELGTQPHSVKKGASVRKGIFVGHKPFHPGTRPRPFVRPAFDATKDDVINEYAKQIDGTIRSVVR